MDVNIYALFIVSVLCVLQFKYIKGSFKLLVYYLLTCCALIAIGKVLVLQNRPAEYFSIVNHIYVSCEALFIGLFIISNLKIKSHKILTTAGILSVFTFELYVFFSTPLIDSQYGSALLASIFCVVLLFSLFDLSQQNYKGDFYKLPAVTVFLSFLITYLTTLIFFWFLPVTIEYSRVWANIMMIFQNIIGALFYWFFYFGIRKHIDRNKL